MDLVYLRGVCNKLSFLNADTDRNRKITAVYLLLVNLLRMCLWVDAGAWLCSFLCRRYCSAGPCMWFLTKSEKRKLRKRLWRILLMKNKTLKHYKRKKFFYRFFMRKSRGQERCSDWRGWFVSGQYCRCHCGFLQKSLRIGQVTLLLMSLSGRWSLFCFSQFAFWSMLTDFWQKTPVWSPE